MVRALRAVLVVMLLGVGGLLAMFLIWGRIPDGLDRRLLLFARVVGATR